MADAIDLERSLGDPSHGHDFSPPRELVEERPRYGDLLGARPAVRCGLTGTMRMRGDDVPEQDVLLDPELAEHAVDDRRRRLGGPRSGQLALRGEGNATDARAAVAGRLADEQKPSPGLTREIVGETLPQARGKRVLVERGSDPRRGQPLYEGRSGQLCASRAPARVRACARTEGENRIIS
jgi:hypothetical protein